MEYLYEVWNKKNIRYPTIDMTTPSSSDPDQIVALKLPYLDPIYDATALCITNLAFWRTVSHLRWFVLRLRNNYIVSPSPEHGFSRPLYLHIECVRFYEDQGYFGNRRLQKKTYQVDHKNCSPLDCTRDNLRIVTPSENSHNKIKREKRPNNKPYTSKYKGVSVQKRKLKSGKTTVRYKVDFKFGKISKRPSYKTEKAAARAYRDLCMRHCPEYSQPTPVSDSEEEEEEAPAPSAPAPVSSE